MKNNVILIVCLSLMVLFSSCKKESIKPSSTITTESVDASDFTELEVENEFNVYIDFSETEEKVDVRANENLHEYITVEQNGDKLEIRIDEDLSIRSGEVLEVYITTKEIDTYKISGESTIYLENNLTAEDIEINISGESKFEGTVICEDLELNMSGESDIKLNGTVDVLDSNIAGESDLKSYDLIVNRLFIDMAGESHAHLTVEESMEVNASGDCILHYKGDADITSQNLSGDSKIVDEN